MRSKTKRTSSARKTVKRSSGNVRKPVKRSSTSVRTKGTKKSPKSLPRSKTLKPVRRTAVKKPPALLAPAADVAPILWDKPTVQMMAAVEGMTPANANRLYLVEMDGRSIPVLGRPLSELQLDPELLQPARIILPLLVAAGRITMLAAREKVGKSTLAAYAVVCKTRGWPLFGEPVERGRVLWVGLEEAASDAVSRFVAMGADPEMLTVVTRLAGENALQQLRAEILSCKPDLVVVDSLAAYGGGLEDENNATAVTALLKPLCDFVHESGVGMLMLHHANKSSSATGNYRGSVAIGAAMDMILEMAEVESTSNVRRVSAKGRFSIPSYELDYNPETRVWTKLGEVRTAEQRAADLQEHILSWLTLNPNAGKERIRAAMGRNATQTDLAIDALLAEEKIRHLGQRQGYVAI